MSSSIAVQIFVALPGLESGSAAFLDKCFEDEDEDEDVEDANEEEDVPDNWHAEEEEDVISTNKK